MQAENLFEDVPEELPEELFTTLHRSGRLRVERIVSLGHASPEGFWYDQEESEWVVVLEGRAELQFEGEARSVPLQRGSYLYIPAHARHRVAWTDPTQKTVWLAVHFNT